MASEDSSYFEVEDLVGSPSLGSLLGVIVVGGALGFLIAFTGRDEVPDNFMLWAAVAVALTTAAGVVAISGWVTWRALVRIWPGKKSSDMALAGGVLLLVVIAGALTFSLPTDTSLRGSLLIGIATLGAVPAVMAMARVSMIARGAKTDGPAVVDTFISLRRMLGRQLRGLGSLVALATLALAVSPFSTEISSGEEPFGGGAVLVLGGVGSAIVAVAYVPVALTLRNAVNALARNLFPIPVPEGESDMGGSVLAILENRQNLTKLIMGERGTYGELVESLVVAGPLLTATIGTYVTG